MCKIVKRVSTNYCKKVSVSDSFVIRQLNCYFTALYRVSTCIPRKLQRITAIYCLKRTCTFLNAAKNGQKPTYTFRALIIDDTAK